MEEAVNKKADESKKKKRTSLKSILGGDIFRRKQEEETHFTEKYLGRRHFQTKARRRNALH